MILERKCPYCRAQGTLPDPGNPISPRKACPICNGRGYNLVPRDANLCPLCQGNGRALGPKEETPCLECHGIGSVW